MALRREKMSVGSKVCLVVAGSSLACLCMLCAAVGMILRTSREDASLWILPVTLVGYLSAGGFVALIVRTRLRGTTESATCGDSRWITCAERLRKPDVQFTVYRPAVVSPATWYPMPVFAHHGEVRGTNTGPVHDPAREVEKQARAVLGTDFKDYHDTTQQSATPVPERANITLLPEIAGVEFNPPQRSFFWCEDVHREEFRLRASPELDGRIACGHMSVFAGSVLLAELTLSIRVDSGNEQPGESEPAQAVSSTPYRKVFASYSHADASIVSEFEQYAEAIGDTFLRDVVHLRTGEVWDDQLRRMIADADVFQLFWSTNSMHSPFVRREWEHALSLQRDNFVRPVYWQEPMPKDEVNDLPPEALSRLHFRQISSPTTAPVDALSEATEVASRPSSTASRMARHGILAALPLALIFTFVDLSVLSRVHPFLDPWSGPSGVRELMFVPVKDVFLTSATMSFFVSVALFIPAFRRWVLGRRKGWSKYLGLSLVSAFSILLVCSALNGPSGIVFRLLPVNALPSVLSLWIAYV